jgi:ABC-2 type transport system ATP-binding protein
MNPNIMELKQLNKSYGDFAIKNLDLTLPAGCIMGFIGENGAGKSTTIKLILDLIRRDSGEISLFGQSDLPLDKALKEDIGVVLDEHCLPKELPVKTIRTIMKNLFKHWDNDQFNAYLDRFSLPLNKKVKDLSRGMRMKLSLAIALSHGAKLLILDEATSGLDPVIRDEILDLFMEFIQDETHSVFVSSHIISDLEKICDYIAFIHQGELLFCETKDELIERYGILKCSKEDFETIDKTAVKGFRKHSFGIEALVERQKLSSDLLIEAAGLEDIMLYNIKESRI